MISYAVGVGAAAARARIPELITEAFRDGRAGSTPAPAEEEQ
jgi:hypothetical protein